MLHNHTLSYWRWQSDAVGCYLESKARLIVEYIGPIYAVRSGGDLTFHMDRNVRENVLPSDWSNERDA